LLQRTKSSDATIFRFGRLIRRRPDVPDDRPGEPDEPIHLSAQEARGGDLVLRTPARRAVYIAGFVLVIVVAAIGYWRGWR
jgi:hypothetical protein